MKNLTQLAFADARGKTYLFQSIQLETSELFHVKKEREKGKHIQALPVINGKI